MNEVLLQTIVEKLEAFERTFQKQNNAKEEAEIPDKLETTVSAIKADLVTFHSELQRNNDSFTILSKEINSLRPIFQDPNQNRVRHIHHLHSSLWMIFSLILISLLLTYGWINTYSNKKIFEANDWKYRFWKANGNSSLLKILYYTDSLYNLDKSNFKKKVLRKENEILELEKIHRLADEKKINKEKSVKIKHHKK